MKTAAPALFCSEKFRHSRDRFADSILSDDNFLLNLISDRLKDRLADIKRPFESVLFIGYPGASLLKAYPQAYILDPSEVLIKKLNHPFKCVGRLDQIPFANHAFDLIVSNLTLHSLNDVPGFLTQLKYCLKPDGFFMTSYIGGNSLKDLRNQIITLEEHYFKKCHQRFAPLLTRQTF